MFDCVGPSGGGGVEGRSVLSSIRHGVPAIDLGMGAGDAGVGENAQLLQNGQGVGGLGGEGDGHRAAPVHHAVLLRQVEAEVQVSLTGVLPAVLVLKKVAGADGARVEIGQHGLPQLLRLGGGEGGRLVALGLDVPEIVDVRLRQAPVRGLVKSIAGPDEAPVSCLLYTSPSPRD